jgi:hypothetical protein
MALTKAERAEIRTMIASGMKHTHISELTGVCMPVLTEIRKELSTERYKIQREQEKADEAAAWHPCRLSLKDWHICYGVNCREDLRDRCAAYAIYKNKGKEDDEKRTDSVHSYGCDEQLCEGQG